MELRHLRYFLAVVDERNFTRAAAVLGVAQPPLSRQIRELETELGAELIDRASRPLKPTEAGWLLYEQAKQVLAGVEQMKTLVRRRAASERRRFVIGCVGSTLYGVVPQMIVRFRRDAPNVDVDVVDMNTFEQMTALKEGRVDVGIGRLRFEEEEGIRRQVIQEEPLVVALPSGHALTASRAPLDLDALAAETLIIYPRPMRPSYADQVLSAFHDQGLSPVMVREARDLQTALGLVAAQAGLCVVPMSVQRLRRDDVAYRRIGGSPLTSPIIVSSRERDSSVEVELFRAIAVEVRDQDGHPGGPA